ncbi:PilZ domain-containing protein [Shewanella aestuarii]|uniref:Cyclic diguanosine monophosphate-binding protein n=1 Tax=Shewanella aestuarii TaxID=1028752 RepID=A0A6G9QIC1_9GAMM|nr:PilZ domain-containing protein [Shewanella aestuarii]QIR13807.1 PilZ domain-containing protein [Shewanella aestuarii]
MDERRKFSRILFDANAYLVKDQSTWRTTILDLSINGALVQLPENFEPQLHNEITLEFILSDSDIELIMATEIVHITTEHLGLRCLHIDVESISHLRRIIELNLGDAELLNRELAMLIQPETEE